MILDFLWALAILSNKHRNYKFLSGIMCLFFFVFSHNHWMSKRHFIVLKYCEISSMDCMYQRAHFFNYYSLSWKKEVLIVTNILRSETRMDSVTLHAHTHTQSLFLAHRHTQSTAGSHLNHPEPSIRFPILLVCFSKGGNWLWRGRVMRVTCQQPRNMLSPGLIRTRGRSYGG